MAELECELYVESGIEDRIDVGLILRGDHGDKLSICINSQRLGGGSPATGKSLSGIP
ncbi:hypothetical protein [Mycolicibacterium brisbanense]|uniref:Uncharacterized protein n=1 Tax=Mycolicibacterium brisbanense TaxID=146020 RepID=A0A100VUK8_9MYCO|nr:hypothetical protein [Mycolicibacterium brisbanense]MCV7156240.1 hypothetical protein [Mycolicibacterium brisbanense]GAS86367.1 uncharacterized protein RMCB_0463 [Mycolicibacterium brisbanense]